MDDSQVNYGLNYRMPRYTEVSSNGEVLFQSDSVPAFVNENYLHFYEPISARNEMNYGYKTSDHYRTFGIPERFENPGMHLFNSLNAIISLFLYNFQICGKTLVNLIQMNSIEHQIRNMVGTNLVLMICLMSIELSQEHLHR